MLENSRWKPQMRLQSLWSSGDQPFALEVSARKLGAEVSIISHVRYFLLWLYHRCELMLFRMGKVSRQLWLYLGPAWKRFVNGDCIFFCVKSYLPNHRGITVWEIRRNLMCLKTLSKSGVSAFISCSLPCISTCCYLYFKFRTKKKEERTVSTTWCP